MSNQHNQYWQGTSDKSKHRGDWYVKNGIEISPEESGAIIDAVANACALKCALSKSGKGPDVEAVKAIISSAKFGASMAARNIEYTNSKVRDTGKPSQTNGQSTNGTDDPFGDDISFG